MTTVAHTPSLAVLADAAAILESLDRCLFTIAYGSHGRARANADSDLDLLYVLDRQPTASTVSELVTRVRRLHTLHRLPDDEEVAYEIKLWTTHKELDEAIALKGFGNGDRVEVTTVPTDPAYLNSARFKSRLILNAITSPHVFLGGSIAAYRQTMRAVPQALARLAQCAADVHDTRRIEGLVSALITDPITGAVGQDWLGYQAHDGPHLYSQLSAHFAAYDSERQGMHDSDSAAATSPHNLCRQDHARHG